VPPKNYGLSQIAYYKSELARLYNSSTDSVEEANYNPLVMLNYYAYSIPWAHYTIFPKS
jgi:hypothetical protein